MSDCSTSTEAPSSEEQEPTIVSRPVVGSSATDNMATSWDSSTSLNVQESATELCNLSLCNDAIPSANASLTCSSEVSSAMPHREIVSPETDSNTFVTSGITQDADSTSGSLGVGNDERMMVDGPLSLNLSIHSVVPPEAVSQESDISEDHINDIENITARRFLRESDLLNAAASALHHTSKTLSRNSNEIRKSNISRRLISLEHQSVTSTQEPEPMEMPNLLHDQHNLESESVSSLTDYQLDHSQTSDMPVGSTSHLDIGSVLSASMRAESVCLSPSSTSSTSSLELPSGSCISSGIGLPPVSTIIRSSASYTKGRFEAFCRPSNISLIMGIAPFLNHNSSFDALSSMGAIQQMPSSPCDVLTSVTLASPLEVSVRQDTCADITMESVDVPLSSSVCSSTSSENIDTIVESGCIKPTSVMSLGPGMITKQNPMSEMSAETHSHPNNNLNLSFTRAMPIQHMVNINASQSQVSLSQLEDVEQKVKSIGDHLDAGPPVSTSYSLDASDESLTHAMIASNFNCRDNMPSSDDFTEQIDHSSQSSTLLPVSAIETNVIMSTSAIDSVPKLASTEVKLVQTHDDMHDEHIQRLQTNQQLDNQELAHQILISQNVETSRNCDIIYSAVQNIISSSEVDATKVYTSIRKKAMHLELPPSRTSIIEKNIQHVHIPRCDSTVTSGAENEQVSSINTAVLTSLRNNSIVSKSPKLQNKIMLEDSESGPLTTVSPSAVTASVIQQLLKSRSSPVKLTPIMQRIPGGVITSVMSIKDEPSTIHKETNLSTSSLKHESHLNIEDDTSDLSISKTLVSTESAVMSNISGKRMPTVTTDFDETSLENESVRSPVLSPSLHTEKETSSLSSVAFPSLFSNISANALAALQSNLSSNVHSIPLSISSSLSAATLIPTTVSLLPPVSSGLASPTASAMPPIVLPSILSSTLRNAATTIKTSVSSSNSMSSTSSNIYTGLLKSVGFSAVVKQEPGVSTESGSLPPFTVVSGLSPLAKRELSTTLTTTLLGATLSSSQIPIVNIKQEPGLADSKTTACEFTASSILSDGSNLSNLTSSHIPSVTSVERSDAAISTATTTVPTSSVPSHASTITFARNASTASAATSSGTSTDTNNKEEKAIIKKWNCPMCKNGSPCGIHPTQSQGSSSQATPQPLLSGDPAKPFQCNLCGKHLASKNVYQLHLRSHSGEKPFTCNLCGHHFSQKTSLTRHMRSHTGERPFPCDVCGKRFADKERIKIHMRTHTGEKPFACEVCGKRFSQKSTVKRHMSVHTGEKPFKCESCGKGFANRGNLNAHSKTHANT